MKLSWAKPPAAMVVGGDNAFVRRRWVREAILGAHVAGFEVVHAADDDEICAALSMGATFGLPTFVVAEAKNANPETVKVQVEGKPSQTCLLLTARGAVDEKKLPATAPIHGAYQTIFKWPTQRKDQRKLAGRFMVAESARLMGQKNAIDPRLGERWVEAVGTDLGTLAFEVAKASALARSEGTPTITVEHVRATVRGSPDADMQPLREALANADEVRVAKALAKIRAKSVTDPTMLLLRARGGPADLAYQWLRVSLLLARGWDGQRIASGIGVPEWAVRRDHIPAARKWGVKSLQQLVRNLAFTDRGLLKGIPAPWVACVASLLQGCRSVTGR